MSKYSCVNIGNILILNPSDDQIKKSEKYNQELKIKRKIIDDKVNTLRSLYILPFQDLIFLMDIERQLFDLEAQILDLIKIRIYPTPEPLSIFFKEISQIISKKTPNFYKIPIIMSETEIVNGYNLFNLDETHSKIFTYEYFTELIKLFNTENTMTKEEFMTKYWNETCSDWAKQDTCGKFFVGYWKYPDDSEEYKNAWSLTKTANGEALYELPYSHALIFETIKIGCGNRQESVKYTNFLCEIIKRKLQNENIEEKKL